MVNQAVIPVEEFKQTLVSNTIHFTQALPSTITSEQFINTIMTAAQNNPSLIKCDKESLMSAAIKCAKDGLLPDGREAIFLPFYNNKENRYIAQYIPMYQGLLKRVRNSNLIFAMDAHIIRQNDYFRWIQGSEPQLDHRPLFPGDRGEMIGVYAIAFYKNSNEKQWVVLSKEEIDEVKKEKKPTNGYYPSAPWVKYYNEMALKTALRRLSKFLPMDASPQDIKFFAGNDETILDFESKDVSTLTKDKEKSPKLNKLLKQQKPIEQPQEIIDAETVNSSSEKSELEKGFEFLSKALSQVKNRQHLERITAHQKNITLRAELKAKEPQWAGIINDLVNKAVNRFNQEENISPGQFDDSQGVFENAS